MSWTGTSRLGAAAMLVLPLAILPPRAAAQGTAPYPIETTRDLLAACSVPANDPSHAAALGLCAGYSGGVVDFYRANALAENKPLRVCLPEPMPTRGQAISRFVAWAENNKQYLDEPATYGMMRFLLVTYPCPSEHGTSEH
jgi:Rap1a immunity proteins